MTLIEWKWQAHCLKPDLPVLCPSHCRRRLPRRVRHLFPGRLLAGLGCQRHLPSLQGPRRVRGHQRHGRRCLPGRPAGPALRHLLAGLLQVCRVLQVGQHLSLNKFKFCACTA